MKTSLLSCKVNTAANISFGFHGVTLVFISFTALTISCPTRASSGFLFLVCSEKKTLILRGFLKLQVLPAILC